MEQTFLDLLKEKGKCCISGKPMNTSEHCNLVTLNYVCSWEFPYETNVLMQDQPRRAVAVVHDDHIQPGQHYVTPGLVKFAVEVRGQEIIYHAVESLQPINYEQKETARLQYCSECGCATFTLIEGMCIDCVTDFCNNR